MKLIVGLGNPGRDYARNRHNAGFMCLSHFAREQGIRLDKKLANARTGTGEIGGEKVVLARPQTFMNLSGQAVARLVDRFKLEPEDIIVIHDDLDLPLGRIRVRRGGGSGGHNGINSIIASLGSRDFNRIRVGISHPREDGSGEADEEDIVSYVLGNFTTEETETIAQIIPRVSDVILCLITEDLTTAMNRYNGAA